MIPKSVRIIEKCAFGGDINNGKTNSLEKVTLQEGLESIREECFSGTNIKEIVIPKSVRKLGNYAFYGYSDVHGQLSYNK